MWGMERVAPLGQLCKFFFSRFYVEGGGKDNGLMLRAQLLRKEKFLIWWETFG